MNVSIIIPVFNAEQTLDKCLSSIFEYKSEEDEVIVIDDFSSDSSKEIAGNFNIIFLEMEKNFGQGHCRNIGIKAARNEILLFIDSDIEIQENTFELTKSYFKSSNADCLTGCLSHRGPYKDFFSDYKNIYMNYIFSRSKKSVNFLYGSICAFRNGLDLSWPEKFNYGEDTELGMDAVEKGYEIKFLKGLEVIHHHKRNLVSSILNDFMIPYGLAKVFIKHKKWKSLITRESFGHVPKYQIISLLLLPIILCSPVFSGFLTVFGLSFWVILNFDFFKFIFKKRGFIFGLLASFWTFFDHLVMLSGVVFGFVLNFYKIRL